MTAPRPDFPKLMAGASGYSYKEWKGNFYPEKMKPDAMLAWYSERLPTVEINNTFYRMPKASGGRFRLLDFARAVAPSQAVAISTQSSLASLPAMLRSAEALEVPVAASGVILPLAVAVFRVTGPAMNLAVVLYVAHWLGIEPGPAQIAAGVAAAALTTLGAVSLPGQISFVTSIAPIGLAMGIPVEPLMLLIAVETLPDIIRTLGNVTMDVAATATVARKSGFAPGENMTEEDRLLQSGNTDTPDR